MAPNGAASLYRITVGPILRCADYVVDRPTLPSCNNEGAQTSSD